MSAPGQLWSSFDHDPRLPANAPLRAADRDRDLIRAALATAYAEGRLDRDEFDERSEQVTSARTLGELPPIVADLVPDRAIELRSRSSLVGASQQELRRRAELHWRAAADATPSWASSAPAWSAGRSGWLNQLERRQVRPLLPMAAHRDGFLARQRRPDHGFRTKADSIEEGVRYLEKKQAKQLRSRRLGK